MTSEQCHIVFAERFAPAAVERMRSVGRVTMLESCEESVLIEAVRDCDALLVRSEANVTRAVFEGARRLRVVGRGGVGLERIDVTTARERGVAVVYTPAAATDSVADLAVGLMISLVRGLSAADGAVRSGRFAEARGAACGRELSGLTLGIVGLGRIGRAVAGRCRNGFGMTVLYNDVVLPGWLDFSSEFVQKRELYGRSDIVSLHVPLTDETRHLIDSAALDEFKPGSFLINTARGAVVDGEALARALCSGKLAGAGLDVFDPEPLPVDDVLVKAPHTLLTPHIGARTLGGLSRMNDVVEDVILVLQGKSPRFPAWV